MRVVRREPCERTKTGVFVVLGAGNDIVKVFGDIPADVAVAVVTTREPGRYGNEVVITRARLS